jgi:hypothetical protein
MAKKPSEDDMDQRLRWMQENVEGAYHAVHPLGHPHAGNHSVNQGTCIIVFCFINALGKVLKKASPGDRKRFERFVTLCMADFVNESKSKGLSDGPGMLYKAFRCGFVHGQPELAFAWGRKPDKNEYWITSNGRLTLNIDELVRGFQRGIVEFKRQATLDPDLRSSFIRYITD